MPALALCSMTGAQPARASRASAAVAPSAAGGRRGRCGPWRCSWVLVVAAYLIPTALPALPRSVSAERGVRLTLHNCPFCGRPNRALSSAVFQSTEYVPQSTSVRASAHAPDWTYHNAQRAAHSELTWLTAAVSPGSTSSSPQDHGIACKTVPRCFACLGFPTHHGRPADRPDCGHRLGQDHSVAPAAGRSRARGVIVSRSLSIGKAKNQPAAARSRAVLRSDPREDGQDIEPVRTAGT